MKMLTYTGKFRLFHPPSLSRALWSLAHKDMVGMGLIWINTIDHTKIVGFTAKSSMFGQFSMVGGDWNHGIL